MVVDVVAICLGEFSGRVGGGVGSGEREKKEKEIIMGGVDIRKI